MHLRGRQHRAATRELSHRVPRALLASNELIQRRPIDQAATVTAAAGYPLEPSMKGEMQRRFGRDFSAVRVHTDSAASESAKGLGALAYTLGDHIVFGRDQYAPGTTHGKRVLAHELAHVAQARSDPAPGVLRRWAVEACATHERESVDEALTEAYNDLAFVLPLMQARPLTPRVRNALWMAFRDESETTARLVACNVGHLHRNLSSSRYRCTDARSDEGCRVRRGITPAAYTTIAGTRPVALCRPDFFALSPARQAMLLVHEAGHAYLGLDFTLPDGSTSSGDRGYFAEGCQESPHPTGRFDADRDDSGTAGDNPYTRLRNVDAYACFVHFVRNVTPRDLQVERRRVSLDDPRIEAVEDVFPELYTRPASAQSHPYRITHAGRADQGDSIAALRTGGFQYRWTLRANERAYGVVSRETGEQAHAFSENHRTVYITDVVRRFLERDRVGRVVLRCEVQPYSPRGGGAIPPTTVVELELSVRLGAPPGEF